jgi:hypothetical protein
VGYLPETSFPDRGQKPYGASARSRRRSRRQAHGDRAAGFARCANWVLSRAGADDLSQGADQDMGDTLGGSWTVTCHLYRRPSAREAQRLDLDPWTCSADVPPDVPTPLLLRDTRREVAEGSDNSSGHRCHRRPVVDRRSEPCVRVRRWLQTTADPGDSWGDRVTGKRVTEVTVTERDHDIGDGRSRSSESANRT